jgi:ribokinase
LPPSLTVVGSTNLDLVASCARLPRPGETVTDASFARHPGGKGANQAVGAARLGATVRFVGYTGRDAFADEALAGLREAGVRLEVEQVAEPTGIALIFVDESGENQIVVAPGANRAVRPPEIGPDETVLAQLEIPIETVEACARRAGYFCLNAAPARRLPPALIEQTDLVVVNRYELEALGGVPRLTALTLGAEGAALLEEGREVARAEPPAVEAVDGTAAGDAFTACLVVSRLEGLGWPDALRRACAAGALAASRAGAQASLPTAAEVDALLATGG